jgi:hypothetical protein
MARNGSFPAKEVFVGVFHGQAHLAAASSPCASAWCSRLTPPEDR